MPLLDHFHPPLAPRAAWASFHTLWLATLVGSLNRLLPRRFRAEAAVHLGRQVAADVAEWDLEPTDPAPALDEPEVNGNGGVAVATWAPPAVTMTVPITFPDEFEVQVLDLQQGRTLVAVIELVSPANKDRNESRDSFVGKCLAYLQRGLGLLVVDVVTGRNAGLFEQLLERLGQPTNSPPPELHAAAYRPVSRHERTELDLWLHPLVIGEGLPVMPLALRGYRPVPVDLETTYTQARALAGL